MLSIFGCLKHRMKRWITCDTIFMKGQGEAGIQTNWSEFYSNALEDINKLETSTYISELISMIIYTGLTLEILYNLIMLGVPIDGPAQILRDN